MSFCVLGLLLISCQSQPILRLPQGSTILPCLGSAIAKSFCQAMANILPLFAEERSLKCFLLFLGSQLLEKSLSNLSFGEIPSKFKWLKYVSPLVCWYCPPVQGMDV